MAHLTILRTDGTRHDEEIMEAPGLAAMQKAVGGNIEVVPRFREFEGRPCVVFCNEYGKLDGLPINPEATRLWAKLVGRRVESMPDVLVGDVLILSGDTSFLGEV